MPDKNQILTGITAAATGNITGAAVAFVSALGVKGKTPTLTWEQRDALTKQHGGEIERQIIAAGYRSDKAFCRIYTDRQKLYVQTHNPGKAGNRAGILPQIERSWDGGGDLYDTMMFALDGCSTNANDPSGVAYRIKSVIDDCVNPAIREYLVSKGIDPGTANAAAVGSALPTAPKASPVTAGVAGGAGVLAVGAALTYLLYRLSR